MTRLVEIQWRAGAGPPVTIGQTTVTPWARALIVRLPLGGFVWNRPVAVVVQQDGQTERIPVRDLTRYVELGLLGVGLLLATCRLLIARRRKEKAS